MTKNLNAESLNQLLEAFSPDSTEAGLAYTKLRDSLVRFFQLKGEIEPDEAADETLDRVASKFSENPEIDDLTKYSFGVARLIFLERLRRRQKEKTATNGFYGDKISLKAKDEEDNFALHRECFGRLADDDKLFLRQYFADLSPSELSEKREHLCVQQNISLNNLRLKVFRLRQRLENCVKRKLGK